MKYLILSATLVFGFVFFVMAYHGIRKGKVYYEPSSPPILFRTHPIRFVLWCTLLIVMGLGCLVFVIKIFRG